MVAAHGGRVRRQEIASAVWDDEDRDVRTLMWSLRRALRDGNSGFDVPPDKGREDNYLLVAEPGVLEEAVDAFRFLGLTRQAEVLRENGDEAAAVERLTAAARLLTRAGAAADRLSMRALAMEASELLTEC